MQSYIGTKVVQAEEMTEHDFLSDGGNKAVDATRANRPGYKVVYADGYTSWSPKEPFELAYRPITEQEKAMI